MSNDYHDPTADPGLLLIIGIFIVIVVIAILRAAHGDPDADAFGP